MSTNTADPMVSLILPLSHVNAALKGLGELPLKESRAASENIEQQARADLARQQEFVSRAGAATTAPAAESAASPAEGQPS